MSDPPVYLDDLTEEQRQLAELVGMEVFLKLVAAYGGSPIYIPMKKSVCQRNRNEQICDDFDGTNYRELSMKYDLSETRIRAITENKLKEIKKAPISGQLNIFDKQE